MRTEWCTCGAFAHWYTEDGLSVCECGHPDGQHIDRTGLCTGDVKRMRRQNIAHEEVCDR